MTNEVLINRLTNIVDEITRIGGEQERTSITPGISVADATPVDLPTGYIKIVNPRDGTWVPCLTINGLVVEDNDLVNVLFTKGTEPIAVSQSATSPSNTFKVSEVWESDFDAVALQADDDGGIGIGTATTPHGGVGIAKFAIDGAAGSATGPHIQLTTDQDNFPRLGIYPWSDDDIRILFDSYRTGAATFLSSDVGSNFSLEKNSNRLGMFYSQGNAQGASVSFLDGIILNRDGEVGIGEFSPSDKLTVKGLTAADCDVGLYANDGDGTDDVNLSLYGIGTPSSKTNRERLLIQYDSAQTFRIHSEANGTGTVRPLELKVGTWAFLVGTETAQDKVEIGDVAGTGDVDVFLNKDQVFLRGSDGVFIIGPGTPSISSRLFVNNNLATTFGATIETGSGGRGFQVITPDFASSTTGSACSILLGAGSGNVDSKIDAFTAGKSASGDLILQSISHGDVSIDNVTPLAKLHVDQSVSTGAKPVLYLDQGDVSEEMIQFQSTIGVGNAIEAVGAKTLTVTHFIKVTLPGSLTRYIPVGTIA